MVTGEFSGGVAADQAQTPPNAISPTTSQQKRERYLMAKTVICPTCFVAVGARCISATGITLKKSKYHPKRWLRAIGHPKGEAV